MVTSDIAQRPHIYLLGLANRAKLGGIAHNGEKDGYLFCTHNEKSTKTRRVKEQAAEYSITHSVYF